MGAGVAVDGLVADAVGWERSGDVAEDTGVGSAGLGTGVLTDVGVATSGGVVAGTSVGPAPEQAARSSVYITSPVSRR